MRLKESILYCLIFLPSIKIFPLTTSKNLGIKSAIVDFPEPLAPTIATVWPFNTSNERLISETTSHRLQKILRKVVTDENGTASLADIHGYSVSGKTGTSQSYNNKKNINTFVSFFDIDEKKKYTLLVLLEDPKIAKNLIYNYRGQKIKAFRNEAGWNAVYVAGKIIEKIGPILAINKEEFETKNVVKKTSN